jgi:ADP-ribosyl-[dinitrogen reductase] hydrolase
MRQLSEGAIIGCILGTAVGDAMGLPFEGLPPGRQKRLFPQIGGHRFLFGKGMFSDDTEHTCMVAQALVLSAGETESFARELARQLKWWLLLLPAGTGFATLRAIGRLWLGFATTKSGVFSAGNGPAMRSALLGVLWGHEPCHFRELVRASTRLTHSDPRAEYGALAVAAAAFKSSRHQENIPPFDYLSYLRDLIGDEGQDFMQLLERATASVDRGDDSSAFAGEMALERGISGYTYHTVPVALHVWLRHQDDYGAAIREIIGCGGDTDTTAAIVGGIIGARMGRAGIPPQWIEGLWEWPRSVQWMEELGRRLYQVAMSGKGEAPPYLSHFALLVRNLFFLMVVLIHGFRRLLPPY